MDIFRISCCNCDMKAKLRITESTAVHQATKHAEATGHRAKVRNVADDHEAIVTDDGVQSDDGVEAVAVGNRLSADD